MTSRLILKKIVNLQCKRKSAKKIDNDMAKTRLNNSGSSKNESKIVSLEGKIPPQALEMEAGVLGILLRRKDAFSSVSDILKPNYFYKPAHEKIYAAIQQLSLSQNSVDILTVAQQLRQNGDLEVVGGIEYLSSLNASNTASVVNIEYYARIIVQKYVLRETINSCSDSLIKAYNETSDVDEVLQGLSNAIFELQRNSMRRDFKHIEPVVNEALRRISEASKNKDKMSGIPSGFNELDAVTSGWQKNDLVIIAARPAMGKTAFVLSMAKNMAVDYKIPCAIFSLEMSDVQLVNRLIVNVTRITGDKIKNGTLENHEWEQLNNKVNDLLQAPIYVDDTPQLSVLELKTKARRLVKEHGVQIIVIDYLQLMTAEGMNFYSREGEVSLISRSLKGLAKELDIPIIALAQVNRNNESRGSSNSVDGRKPQLSDLRESGAIEQDADMVCFIHRPEYYKIYEDPQTGMDLRGLAQILIAKHRNGATKDINLRFISEYALFLNMGDSSFENRVVASSRNNGRKTETANNIIETPLPDSSNDDFDGISKYNTQNSVF